MTLEAVLCENLIRTFKPLHLTYFVEVRADAGDIVCYINHEEVKMTNEMPATSKNQLAPVTLAGSDKRNFFAEDHCRGAHEASWPPRCGILFRAFSRSYLPTLGNGSRRRKYYRRKNKVSLFFVLR